jgi:hypothetical protein
MRAGLNVNLLISLRYIFRYIVSIGVSDISGHEWLQSFNDTAVIIVGMTANQLYELQVSENTHDNSSGCSSNQCIYPVHANHTIIAK